MTTRREFLSKSSLSLLGLSVVPALLTQCKSADADAIIDTFSFARVTPESEGIASEAIASFINEANKSGLEWHSFKILRRGNVLAEGHWSPFKEEYKHTLYSLSKSFTSTAVGLAVREGLITVEDSVISFFPEELPNSIDEHLQNMKIKHLLTMNSGHDTGTMDDMRAKSGEQTWIKSFLEQPLAYSPGTHFFYNTGATYILGAIIHAKTGQNLEEYLKPRFFDKLEISDYDWERSPEGLNTAGYGLRVKTEDIAKLGQFYLQNGTWNGEEILSAEWVAEASKKHTESQQGDGDWSQGYGYQFWRCKPEPGFYRGDGAYGQYCIIIPQYDMTIAVTSESFDMGKSMQIIWDTILPAVEGKPLRENRKAHAELKALCESLSIKPPKNKSTSTNAALINKRIYKAASNDYGIKSLTFDVADDQGSVVFETNDGQNVLNFGLQKWLINDAYAVNNFPIPSRTHMPSLIEASATWIDDDTLQITRKFVEAIHGDTLLCNFNEDEVTITFKNSISQNTHNGEDEREPLLAKA
ncbi:serine hydrolase domain-containing protein [Arcticibacterium luteifluviistationis]|uniref:Serine hydrolase n=1 Tax=Arcticibacterium luteifluviistationis TaxID=1784714 RepID=A0A2Z4GE13_9BACT|nr:serine hydrolase [Arcticibacterium luteifluviistationis]AWV99143.1 serine hydrolase [Arcticibacterium luteifluviistationis]